MARSKEQTQCEDPLNFIFTDEQREMVCDIFNVNKAELEPWQVDELLDKLIDNVASLDIHFQA